MDSFWIFTPEEKSIISSLLEKGKQEQQRSDRFALISFSDFYQLFDEKERDIIKKFLLIRPENIGYKLPFLGYGEVPSDLVAISDQPYKHNGNPIPCQYLPKRVFDGYVRLNDGMYGAIQRKVGVLYGYRSPARQVFMFFDILQRVYDFDFDKAIQRVCLPAYSEHVCEQRQAIDFINQDGVCNGFEETREYAWLEENAEKFSFYKSYGKDNPFGMMFEPWHWRYREAMNFIPEAISEMNYEKG